MNRTGFAKRHTASRRSVLVGSGVALGALSGCLSRLSTESNVSESEIEDCEVSYLEAELFDGDPPSIDASVTSSERHDTTFEKVVVESTWIVPGVDVLEIEFRPGDSLPADAPSSADDPFADLEAFHDTLSAVLESGDETVVHSGHDEFYEIRDAFIDAFDLTGAEGKTVTLAHDGEPIDASLSIEEFHGDGEAEAVYYVSDTETYRVDSHDGEPEDGIPMSC
ncbi:hypothetical protein [Natrarchaeobius chitinivorans]|uniref:Uncharacterized protein n=1 Tax=Natrarchaeobius chitinivorans TaxID=1679083 RepID=A0A3N6LVP5_NATCH|nr:hypothetical protein [Natrarchaeobius chitinivorans]RQG94543.1 hypothetical protein EA473_10660 [Natrarchaeobius chitinivorans]